MKLRIWPRSEVLRSATPIGIFLRPLVGTSALFSTAQCDFLNKSPPELAQPIPCFSFQRDKSVASTFMDIAK